MNDVAYGPVRSESDADSGSSPTFASKIGQGNVNNIRCFPSGHLYAKSSTLCPCIGSVLNVPDKNMQHIHCELAEYYFIRLLMKTHLIRPQ